MALTIASTSLARIPAHAGPTTVSSEQNPTARLTEGDLSGDGRADVMAITTDGRLMYYRYTGTGLASGVQVGHGWSNFRHVTRISEGYGPGTSSGLLALRNDGTLWGYPVTANGRVGTGKLLRSGLAQYRWVTNSRVSADGLWGWAADGIGPVDKRRLVEEVSSPTTRTATSLVQVAGYIGWQSVQPDGLLWMHDPLWDFEMAQWWYMSAYGPVGRGWTRMSIVASPGSLDGDARGDLVARRQDGNLYRYTNTGDASTNRVRWGSAVQIGRNWNAIRLIF